MPMVPIRPRPVEPLPDFPKLERQLLADWERSGIVKRYLTRNANAKRTFSFLDGPITANNPMGVHHAWGRTYKDIWQRFFNMRGMRQRFQNGFDAQGLWVEVEVEKELGFTSKKDIEKYGVDKFVGKCKERVFRFAKIQTEQSKRLGYFMDWDHSYYTLSDENNYMIWHFLKVCDRHGWLYKGVDSVPWCPRCQTAISQHEMLTEDYQEVIHESIYLRLPIVGKDREFLLVWTTTPWTIPANIAVAVDERLEYAQVTGPTGDKFWLAKDTVERVFKGNHRGINRTVKGNSLVGKKYIAPFDHLPAVKKIAGHPKFHTVIATDQRILPVTTDEGTGLVHTAVSAGTEDFRLGKKLDLPMVPVIGDNADYLGGLGFLTGTNAKTNPRLILDYLLAEDNKPGVRWVFAIHEYQHRYPACWRCKTELVWKVTDEWYISMDRPSQLASGGKQQQGKTLRQRMMALARTIHWIPAFGLDRELDWLKNMQDWLISKKNRYWGLCLPIWECQKCGEYQVIGSQAELRKKAVAGWEEFAGQSPHKPQIDRVRLRCPACGKITQRIEAVGNPWLDAGIVPFSTITERNRGRPLYLANRRRWQDWFPADLVTESFPGQFKNWFYSLIAMSTVLENSQPMRRVLGFATLLGEDGRPMHKSWGNAIEFNEGADKIGVDVMRWMYTRQNPTDNLLFGYHKAAAVRRQFYLILWNAFRFVVNNLALEEARISSSATRLSPLDRWIRSRLATTIDLVTASLEEYDAPPATQAIESFVQDFSTWYIRRSRDRVGPLSDSPADTVAFYRTSVEVLTTLARLLAPFLPFISELIYRTLTGDTSVHLAAWPRSQTRRIDRRLEAEMNTIRDLAEKIHAARKRAKLKTRQPLRSVTLRMKPLSIRSDPELLEILAQEVNVRQVKRGASQQEGIAIELDTRMTAELRAEGEAREIIRVIQDERKKRGVKPREPIIVRVPAIPAGFEAEIRRRTFAEKLLVGEPMSIRRSSKVGQNRD